MRSSKNRRNVSLEIGITLPIYVIITGYFQGVVNIMIYFKWVIFTFTHFLILYPVIIGGVFGFISLFLTKRIIYLKRPWLSKKAHKVMVPKKIEEEEDPSIDKSPLENPDPAKGVAQSLYPFNQ
jgi:hypothetical protein